MEPDNIGLAEQSNQEKEQNIVMQVVQALTTGTTEEQLLQMGIPQSIIDKAKQILTMQQQQQNATTGGMAPEGLAAQSIGGGLASMPQQQAY